MTENALLNDRELTVNDVKQLENAQQIINFFAELNYNVDDANKLNHAALQLDSDDLRLEIQEIWHIATDPVDEDIKVYLLEVKSVTIKLIQMITRRLREIPGEYLLVLTVDFDELHFVFLDPVLNKSKQIGKSLTRVLRPRIIKVDRQKISRDSVELRVLKRFTFTEEDAVAQRDKLRSAYVLAEWSEEYFNNRALFSDYYLKHRLTDPKTTPEWAEDAAPVLRKVVDLIRDARRRFTGKPEATVRKDLFEPLFDLLSLEYDVVKGGDSSASEPDYRLYATGKRDQPIALALTYVWNRNLDDMDNQRDSETPDEIPGALVVSILESTDVPWVIVTNGKLWRLYSTTASNKATNYYEVDLEEAANATEQIKALKYWWLLFRQQAFTGFLDALLQNSEDYAKGLRERLKDSIFESIFPQFAEGFIANIKAQGVAQADVDAMLPTIFSGTMTFLYRMMFILYAESLELLPIHEEGGYREHSLYTLKNEIAKVGGEAESVAQDKLRKKYSPSSLELYERLKVLFHVIDKGSEDLNMPTYNGGLFSTETDSGKFLETYAIPDRYLACGLDRLARDEDDKSKQLVMVDFKSLGVRQLGSIYEGLLEFKLKRAKEDLAVIKDGGKEVYLPAQKAGKKRIITTVKKGEIYLDNDKSERKATGSYYTPDYIVKYIVEHTVEPVLQRKFAELTPRLREADREYRNYAKLVEARKKALTSRPPLPHGEGENADTFWNSDKMQHLVDDCLNVRVLDPAMGSGHFLVEVVDYVSNRLIDFLNGWSENPVWAMLEQTKQDIVEDLTRQHVSVNFERLNRVALLKRAVLKRVVYGVDLNAMAVELAKVSLWLNAFTLGAPLSFLDHHLKHGNSLIGARVADVQDYLKAKQGEMVDMFSGSRFAGVMLATDLMRQVSYLSDNTIAQAEESKTKYRSAYDNLAPYKRVLDVYTSRWFGNGAGKKAKTDNVRLFLQDPQTEAWFKDPTVTLDNSLITADDIATNALQAANDKHFFHWELEFPEVFFAPSTRGGQDVQLRDDGGFDAVVGNPPYDVILNTDGNQAVEYLSYINTNDLFHPALGGRLNIFRVMMVQSITLISPTGYFGMIVPLSLIADKGAKSLRKLLMEDNQAIAIECFPQKDDANNRVFPDAKLSTCIYIGTTGKHDDAAQVRVYPGKDFVEVETQFMRFEDVYKFDEDALAIPLLSAAELNLLLKLHTNHTLFSEISESKQGEVNITNHKDCFSTEKLSGDMLKGSEISRYEQQPPSQGEKFWLNIECFKTRTSRFQDTQQNRVITQQITGVDDTRRLVAYLIPPNTFCGNSLNYTLSKTPYSEYYCLAFLNSNLANWRFKLTSSNNHVNTYELNALPAKTIDFTTPAAEREQRVQQILKVYEHDNADGDAVLAGVQAALAEGKSDVVHDVLAHLAQVMIDLNKDKQAEVKRFLGWLAKTLKIIPPKTGAHTGTPLHQNDDKATGAHIGTPLHQNDDKATGVTPPLSTGEDGWGSTNAFENFTGKTIIQNYLGDYQKGEKELVFEGGKENLVYRLNQNKNKFHAKLADVKGQIQSEYESSLETLRPIKQQLSRTDALIDRIVYKLYGLTDAEIELIERPQYEQAISEARESVLADKSIEEGSDEALSAIGDKLAPAALRYAEVTNTTEAEASLDNAFPQWRTLPDDLPKLLLSAEKDYLDESRADYSGSVINYAKVVEISLNQKLFLPFKQAGFTANDVVNEQAFKKFMVGKVDGIMLGSVDFVLSSQELRFRQFVIRNLYPDAEKTLFAKNGMRRYFEPFELQRRNDAAHNKIMTRDEAQAARAWAFAVLAYL